VIDQAVRDRNLHNPADKAAAVEEALPFVRAVRSRIQRREYFDIAMDALRVQPDQRRELWQRTRTGASMDAAAVQQVVARARESTVAEERLLQLLLTNDELRSIILPRLEVDDYEGLATAALFRAIVRLTNDGKDVTVDSLTEEAQGDLQIGQLVARLMIGEQPESFDDTLASADSCLDALRLLRLNRRIDEVSFEIAEAERAGDDVRRDALATEHLQLSKRRSNFLPPPRQ